MPAVKAETGEIKLDLLRPWASVKKGYTNFRDGDVLFAKITPCMENGKVALCEGLLRGLGAGSTEFHVIRPGQCALEGKYLLFYLLQRSVRSNARLVMKGAAGQLRVPLDFLLELPVPLPPLPEQRRIVAEIEKQFTRLASAIELISAVRKRLETYLNSALPRFCALPPDISLDGKAELPHGWRWIRIKDAGEV